MNHRSIQFDSFRVDFAPSGDRVSHAIYVAEPAGDRTQRRWVELLRSVESPADAVWPDSPPLQELHVEDRHGQSVALLVGRAGKSHWSASIGRELAPKAPGDSAEQLFFDIACRVSTSPALLASTYQLADGVARLGQQRPATVDPTRWQSLALVTSAGPGWQVTVDAPGVIVALPATREFRIEPPPTDAVPATVRWRFCVTATPQHAPPTSVE